MAGCPGIRTPSDPDALPGADVNVRILVEDTGKGIAQDRITMIFDPFTQEDNSITRHYGGSGLGLSIINKLLNLMGGNIAISSQIGMGTKFKVIIPFKNPTQQEKEYFNSKHKSSHRLTGEHLHILLAEDNSVNAIIAKSFLTKFGYTVHWVLNGKLAVEAVAENKYDLIFMDIHMPEMDGIAATRKIRETHKSIDLPIIGLTAEAFTEQHLEFMEAGMDDVLTKPYTEQQLSNIISGYGGTASVVHEEEEVEMPMDKAEFIPLNRRPPPNVVPIITAEEVKEKKEEKLYDPVPIGKTE